jgi:hypothetical protein
MLRKMQDKMQGKMFHKMFHKMLRKLITIKTFRLEFSNLSAL